MFDAISVRCVTWVVLMSVHAHACQRRTSADESVSLQYMGRPVSSSNAITPSAHASTAASAVADLDP